MPSQTTYPWRATVRTVLAAVISIAAVWGLVVQAAGVDETTPVVATTIAVAGAITRIMAIPAVNDLLTRFGLGAEPKGD
ncbi:MAG TPA: hypothetical protein VIP28_07290 [Nocardioides sp.]